MVSTGSLVTISVLCSHALILFIALDGCGVLYLCFLFRVVAFAAVIFFEMFLKYISRALFVTRGLDFLAR